MRNSEESMQNSEESENPLGCPVVSTLNLIGGKWKPMVIHILSRNDQRFGQLKRSLKPISQKVLTEQLRELERNGIVQRDVINGKIPNVTYLLTSHGRSLVPVLEALYTWGEKNGTHANRTEPV